jgi:sugar (pentulose or hexulose) kinase
VTLLGLDLGTTHCKAVLFDADGVTLRAATRPTPVARTETGLLFHPVEGVWTTIVGAVREVVDAGRDRSVQAIGVTGMAEAGLLVDRRDGDPRTHIIPWYDNRAAAQVDEIARIETPRTLFRRSGLHPSFKFAIPKLLWLRERDASSLHNALWLSVPDFIVYRLTGRFVTDPSLAARTYAYDLAGGRWDDDWITTLELPLDLFPPILATGEPAGSVSSRGSAATLLPTGVPVAVCGHDHVVTMLPAGVLEPGRVLDSVGTAESLLGVLRELRLDDAAYDSGLAVVPHVLRDRFCWLGGLSAAGGSIEWLRRQLGDPPLSYQEIVKLARDAGEAPTGILYFPYLSGSGAPLPDGTVRGALAGLDAAHTRGHLVRAVLEGTAYAAEGIRRTAGELEGSTIGEMIAIGGAARNDVWMQIKADVCGVRLVSPAIDEGAALGAALAVALGCDALDLAAVTDIARRLQEAGREFLPNGPRHDLYCALYQQGFMALQEPLRRVSRSVARVERDA